MASDMLTEWLVVLFGWLLVNCLKEWVQLLVCRGMVRMRWCDVEEKKRKRSEEKKRLYARGGTQSGSDGEHVQAGTCRHQVVDEGRHVKVKPSWLARMAVTHSPSSLKKASDRMSATAKRTSSSKQVRLPAALDVLLKSLELHNCIERCGVTFQPDTILTPESYHGMPASV